MKVVSSEDVQRESECDPLIAAAVDDIYSLEDEPESKDEEPCPAITVRKPSVVNSSSRTVQSKKKKKSS